ncbi:MAG: hypothetical protein ACREMC_10455 [Gemmatimonadales bacterium]
MKQILITLGLVTLLGAAGAAAQTRVSVSIAFGAPFVAYHPRAYHYRPYVVYHPRPTLVVVRPYRPARVVVVRSRPVVAVRHHPRRHHRRW